MRETEIFAVDCWQCGHAVELPTTPPHRCPLCGTELDARWRPEEPVNPSAAEQGAK